MWRVSLLALAPCLTAAGKSDEEQMSTGELDEERMSAAIRDVTGSKNGFFIRSDDVEEWGIKLATKDPEPSPMSNDVPIKRESVGTQTIRQVVHDMIESTQGTDSLPNYNEPLPPPASQTTLDEQMRRDLQIADGDGSASGPFMPRQIGLVVGHGGRLGPTTPNAVNSLRGPLRAVGAKTVDATHEAVSTVTEANLTGVSEDITGAVDSAAQKVGAYAADRDVGTATATVEEAAAKMIASTQTALATRIAYTGDLFMAAVERAGVDEHIKRAVRRAVDASKDVLEINTASVGDPGALSANVAIGENAEEGDTLLSSIEVAIGLAKVSGHVLRAKAGGLATRRSERDEAVIAVVDEALDNFNQAHANLKATLTGQVVSTPADQNSVSTVSTDENSVSTDSKDVEEEEEEEERVSEPLPAPQDKRSRGDLPKRKRVPPQGIMQEPSPYQYLTYH